jgi:hypothetical protein
LVFCLSLIMQRLYPLAQALTKAGFTTTVIRTARADDPAPAGSLLIAIDVDNACAVRYDDGNGPQWWTAGHLTDGTCLPT